ncbi:MAG: hypothetical protein JNL10_03385 [Verrucomicrobiales bacterium]|nr:hypothetical protein [Verrucomicrobiales bacterium]
MSHPRAKFPLMAVVLSQVLLSGCGESAGGARTGFRPELRQSEVRVVLLRVGPRTSSTSQPTFQVTYGVEVPATGAFSDLGFKGNDEIALLVRGKPIPLPGGFSSSAMGFGELSSRGELRKPTLQEGKAMIFEDITFPALQIDAGHLDLRIQFSWRGTPLRFDFEDVPVGYRNAGEER